MYGYDHYIVLILVCILFHFWFYDVKVGIVALAGNVFEQTCPMVFVDFSLKLSLFISDTLKMKSYQRVFSNSMGAVPKQRARISLFMTLMCRFIFTFTFFLRM